MERRLVFNAINKPMTIFGIDRRLFFGALMSGAMVFQVFEMFLGGLLTTILLYILALVAHHHDPRFFDILMASRGHRTVYDAAKREEAHGPW